MVVVTVTTDSSMDVLDEGEELATRARLGGMGTKA